MKGLMQHKSDLRKKSIHVDVTQIIVALISAGAIIASAFIGRI